MNISHMLNRFWLFCRSTIRSVVTLGMSDEMNGKQFDTTESVNGHRNGLLSITVQLRWDDLAPHHQFRQH